jgi:hypothetical protein
VCGESSKSTQQAKKATRKSTQKAKKATQKSTQKAKKATQKSTQQANKATQKATQYITSYRIAEKKPTKQRNQRSQRSQCWQGAMQVKGAQGGGKGDRDSTTPVPQIGDLSPLSTSASARV